MRLRRVYENSDGTLRIYYPLEETMHRGRVVPLRLDGESDEAFLARMGEAELEHDPTKKGRPHVDVDADTLPDPARWHAWRLRNGRVVIDPSVPDPPPRSPRIPTEGGPLP